MTTNEYRAFDPTDTGDERHMTPATPNRLADLQMAYGICSEGACEQPIWRWCETCGAKLCYTHIRAHERAHIAEELEAATTIPALPIVG